MDGKGPSQQLTPLFHAGKPDAVSVLFGHHRLFRIKTAPVVSDHQLYFAPLMDYIGGRW